MTAPPRMENDERQIVYAGRFADRLSGNNLPGSCVLLNEQDVLAHKLDRLLKRADALVVLDLLSFPLGAVHGEHWDVPLVVVLPPDSDAKSLIATFGKVLFERLGFFDYIATKDSVLWEELRRQYRWAEGQLVAIPSNDPSEWSAIRTLLEIVSISPATPEAAGNDYDWRLDKALHRTQAAVLAPRFAAVREKLDTGAPLDVLEVGVDTGRWVSSFDPEETRFVGTDIREGSIDTARRNFPEGRFDYLGPDLLFPYEDESFDLVFSVGFVNRVSGPARKTLLSEMWRLTRPGGRLLFLESFVPKDQPGKPNNIRPISVNEFQDLILDATAGRVALEYVESLRYPDEDLRRGGLVSLLRLGVPKA